MNEITLTVFFYLAILVVVLLSLCVIYLIFAYRNLLEKYTDLSLSIEKSEIKQKIKLKTNEFVNNKINSAVTQAVDSAVNLISKKADEVGKIMREETIEKLKEDEVAERKSVAAEYDQTDDQIKKYKEQNFEEIRRKANEILPQVVEESLTEFTKKLSLDEKDALVIKALENAKQQNIF